MTPESFAAFYALFPRKVARKSAEKAWARVATSEALIEQIMAGLKAQLPELLKTYKRDRSMVPHPATWLNGRRFEDEQAPVVTKQFLNLCTLCGGVEQVLIGPPMLEIRRCACVAGNRIVVLGQIHPDDWSGYQRVLAGVEESA